MICNNPNCVDRKMGRDCGYQLTPEVVHRLYVRRLHRRLRELREVMAHNAWAFDAMDEYNHVGRLHARECGCGLRWLRKGNHDKVSPGNPRPR